MRRISLLALVPVLVAAPLAAQAFEGVVSVKTSGVGGLSDADWFVKGDRMEAKLIMPASSGPMAGKEGKTIIDGTAGTMTMLIPMEMGNSKGVKMVIDARKAGENATVDVKTLGTSATIAGYHCEDYQITDGKNVTVVCMSTQLGHFAMGSGGPMGGNNGWAAIFQSHPGFPLRVIANGKTNWEVTAVKRGSVPDDAFVIPDGYMDMSGMGGMMGRGGRGGRGGGGF